VQQARTDQGEVNNLMSSRLPQRPIEIVSVNIAEPREIGTRRGRPVQSGIVKHPVASTTIELTTTNLVGDRQADLRVHGGPDKAVYAYPVEHLALWNEELGVDPPFGPGTFGENLTIRGWIEEDVRAGDIWAWGDARLQIVDPRGPCFKLAMVTGRPDIVKRMNANGRTGWYLRVLQPATVPTTGPIELIERIADAPSIRDMHFGH
jgi:MOSC domain-containing protein YiiM